MTDSTDDVDWFDGTIPKQRIQMPTVMKTEIPKGTTLKKPGVPSSNTAAILSLTLPKTLSEPVSDLNEYHGIITGEPGIGKTTLGMQEPGVFLLTFDPFAKSLKAYQRHAPDWKHFEAYLKLLETAAAGGQFPYKRVVVDGVDLWFRYCQAFVCDRLKIDHPSEEAWGKAWDALGGTFLQAVDRLMRLPCGVWFICHAKDKEIEKRDGTKVEKLRPILTARAEEIVVGKCNFMLNIHYRGDDRIGTIRGSEDISAKCNIDQHFMTPDGRQVIEIFMGNESPKKAWEAFQTAFNNEQTYTTYDEYIKNKSSNLSQKGGAPIIKKTTMKKV